MKKYLFSLFLFSIFLAYPVSADVKLPSIVSDHMILQRDAVLKIWGWADKNEKITLSFMGSSYKTRADKDGNWEVMLPAIKAGGPYNMVISAGNRIEIKDIMIGDVWLCSGQSNMEHYLGRHRERFAKEIAEANYPEIRQFLVPKNPQLNGPVSQIENAVWKPTDPKTVLQFSVVSYFFALKLYEKYDIPVGIINVSVGGSPIQAWTSEEGLKEFPDLWETIMLNKDTARVNRINREAAEDMRMRFKKPDDKGLNGEIPWYDPAYVPRNWHNINIPGYWEDQGIRNLDGVVWYRREIEVPASMTGIPAKIYLGRIVDSDELYINGQKVGSTAYQYPQRWYTAEPGVLKAGKNLFVVRVVNNFGKGGFVPDKPYYIKAGEEKIDLKGYWQYRVGEVFVHEGFGKMAINAQNQPSALYNGMVAPCKDYKVKGFAWYQGESNAAKPLEYRKLLPALINDWRRVWNDENLPFLIVQLPNFMDVNYSPEESNWALVREAQQMGLELPATALAVAIDLGEWNDIHPGNKKPVGERLALGAMKVAYGEKNIVNSGPTYESQRVEGNKIIITFGNTGSGLTTSDGEEPGHFAIAGADKKFKWGKAKIEGNTVIVWNDDIEEPVYIRYAWADNPDFANLVNKEGLPASPFRTDR